MGNQGRRRQFKGDSEEINSLAAMLDGWLTVKRMTLDQLYAVLVPEDFESGAVPSRSAVGRQLQGLALGRELVQAVARACAPDESIRQRWVDDAEPLLKAARERPTPLPTASGEAAALRTRLAKATVSLVESQQRELALHLRVEELQDAKGRSEKARDDFAQTVTMLMLMLGRLQQRVDELTSERDLLRDAGSPGANALLQAEARLTAARQRRRELEADLEAAERERDEARAAVREAARQIGLLKQELARRNAAAGPSSAEPPTAAPAALEQEDDTRFLIEMEDYDRAMQKLRNVRDSGRERLEQARATLDRVAADPSVDADLAGLSHGDKAVTSADGADNSSPGGGVTRAAAERIADGWINGGVPPSRWRTVRLQELDWGFVAWAADPGEPAEGGSARMVIARDGGAVTLWPALPVDDVVRYYTEVYRSSAAAEADADADGEPDGDAGGEAGGEADEDADFALAAPVPRQSPEPAAELVPPPEGPGVPTVGSGHAAVLRYRAADGAEQELVFRSRPGDLHPEWQALRRVRELGVPPDQVIALHTDLEPCDLPGGYCARLLKAAWPSARTSHTIPYGRDHLARRQSIGQLLAQQEDEYIWSGGPEPTRAVRSPLPPPESVRRLPPMPVKELAAELDQVFGRSVYRFDESVLARQGVPPRIAETLTVAGLPREFGPFFWAVETDGGPVPTVAEPAAVRRLPAPGHGTSLVLGNDFGRQLCLQPGTAEVIAIDPVGGEAACFVNMGVPEFARSLAMAGRMWRLRYGLTPEQAGRWTTDFQNQLLAIDPYALRSPQTWWAVLLEQFWDGLL